MTRYSPPRVRQAPSEQPSSTGELERLRASEAALRDENADLLEAQILLEESRDDYAELYDLAALAQLTLGPGAVLRTANWAAAELLEEERNLLIGRAFDSLVHPLDRGQVCQLAASSLREKAREVRLLLPSGALVPVQMLARASAKRSGVLHVTLVDQRERPGASNPLVRQHRLLLVEDHDDTGEVIQALLEDDGYAVVRARLVAEALQVDLGNIDAIISDVNLPDGTAHELLRKWQGHPAPPAIALSGHGTQSDIDAIKRSGFDLHLTKPVDFDLLTKSVRALLTYRAVPEALGNADAPNEERH